MTGEKNTVLCNNNLALPVMTNLELEISNPCNERCVHCYRTCSNTAKGFLSAAQAENIAEQVVPLMQENHREVLITGGESMLNPEWKEIVKCFTEKGFRVSLFTNGTLLDKKTADFLAQFNRKQLKEVQFSLYAIDEKVHDSVTRLKGSFQKTMKAIKLLRERKVPVFVSCPAMQENKKAFPDLMRWADKNDIPSCVDLYIFGSSDYTGSNLSQRLSFTDLEDFFKISLENDGELSYIWGNKKDVDLTEKFYGAASSLLCISGDGTIYPMIGWYTPLGSIHTDSIKNIFFNSPFLQKIRTISISDIPECHTCEAVNYCFFCPSPHITANNGELYKLDKDFCNFIKLKKNFVERRYDFLKKVKTV